MALTGDQEAGTPAREAMVVLNELALAQPLLDRSAWFGGLCEMAMAVARADDQLVAADQARGEIARIMRALATEQAP